MLTFGVVLDGELLEEGNGEAVAQEREREVRRRVAHGAHAGAELLGPKDAASGGGPAAASEVDVEGLVAFEDGADAAL